MSHFTVLVVGDDVEGQLAPYQENNMGDCPKEYLEFVDQEDECKQEYETEGSDEWYPNFRHKLKTKDIEKDLAELKKHPTFTFTMDDKLSIRSIGVGTKGTVTGFVNNKPGSENYRVNFCEVVSYETINGHDLWDVMTDSEKETMEQWHSDPVKLSEAISRLQRMIITVKWIEGPKKIPYKEQFTTFDDFMKEYHGYKDRDEKTGKYGYWENPNRKWDWYQVGGRWSGFFKLRPGTRGIQGEPGLMTRAAEPGYVDQALKKDIDFETMFDEKYDAGLKRWDAVNEVIKDFPKPESWPEVRDRIEDIDEARDFYHEQPMVKAFQKWAHENSEWDELEPYLVDRKEFATKRGKSVFITFALLKDGKWYERGDMGWWGMVSDEDEDWDDKFFNLLNELDDDTLLTVIDCHI